MPGRCWIRATRNARADCPLPRCWGIIRPMNETAQIIRDPALAPAAAGAIRQARLDDVTDIHRLLTHYASLERLLPRAEPDIYQSLREFVVAERDGRVVGCASLQIFTRDLGEVRSLAVDPDATGMRIGSRLVGALEDDARRLGLSRLMALTYEVSFFNRMGYEVVEMKVLPEKVWGACINCPKFRNCDEIAVLKYLSATE